MPVPVTGLKSLGPRQCRPLRSLVLPARAVWFPPEGALGRLFLLGPSGGCCSMSACSRRWWAAGWREAGPASGRILVPAGNLLKLLLAAGVEPRALRQVAPAQIEAFAVRDGGSSEALLSCLDRFPHLRQLDFWTAPVGDEVMPAVARLEDLQELNLWGTRVGAHGLALLALRPGLRRLILPGAVGDLAMGHVAALLQLRELDCAGTAITDAGLRALSRLPSLTRLSLWGTRVTDAGLWHLAHFPSLRDLDLGGTAVTDGGLAALASLPLRSLSLRDTLVTPAGLRSLRAALAGTEVAPGPGPDRCPGWRPPVTMRPGTIGALRT